MTHNSHADPLRIVYLTAGAANAYCGSCLRDNTLSAAMRRVGHDVMLVPTYTPIRTDEANISESRIFFGGVNVYLQQHMSIFRHTPWFLDRILDNPGLLKCLSKRETTIDPAALGDLTVSMVRGDEGFQRKEILKLVSWLKELKPEVVHISNAMMIGMAGEIRKQIGCPIVCSLSGEDVFIERLQEPFYTQTKEAMQQRADHADAYIAMNQYYADYMIDWMGIAADRTHVVPLGLSLDGHSHRQPGATDEVTIGYLARITPDKGLHHLVDAFRELASDPSLPPLKLRVAGYMAKQDRPYLEAIEDHLKEWNLLDRYEYVGEVSRDEKIQFLHSIDMMSMPTVYKETKGLSVFEALANGVPVIQPAHGTFPEIINDTGGGLLFEPDNPHDLAVKLRELIVHPELRRELGARGHEAIHDRYHDGTMCDMTVGLYRRLLGRETAEPEVQEVRQAGA